ncbi:MAG: UDP-N-acetylmuramoyl-L-alanine--D-glutamate ligase [Bacteroidia bacterium]
MKQKIAILGAGESGVGAALLAKQQGAEVWVSDGGKIADRFRSVLTNHVIPFEEGKHTKETFFDSNLVIKSPGIPEHAAIVQEIRASHTPVISEIEYAFRCSGAKIIAITGSNGKTTTTSLIWHLAKAMGWDAALVGNIGKSFAWQVATDPKPLYVLEVSSFQLDDIDQFRPDIALLLNITPDHLDRYGYDIVRYGKAKFRIAENQRPDDTFIYSLDDPETHKQMPAHSIQAQALGFALEKQAKAAAWTEEMGLCVQNELWADFQLTQLLGPHNQLNALAALLAVNALGVPDRKPVVDGLYSFQAIEHRLEKVKEADGILYINDSKATNIDAVFHALKGLETPIIWLAGGVDKGNDYSVLAEMVKEKVKSLIILGEHREALDKAFPFVERLQVMSMEEGVRAAKKIARSGDVVLLSPACASFDLFQNYEDRGRQFKKEVMND